MRMKSLGITLAAAGLAVGFAGGGASSAAALQPPGHRRTDQGAAYDQLRRGEALSLREIEGRVIPHMRGATYLGPELHEDRYRLKFMDKGAVIWVDVDPRTGAIIGRAGD